MKKTFKFKISEGKYILENTKPDEKKEPFEISMDKMEFDTSKFYEYVFSDINEKFEIEIINKIGNDNKSAYRVYETINEMCSEIIDKINDKLFK